MLAAEPDFSGLYDVLEKFERVGLAVSGGADSTALMAASARWAKENGRVNDIHVVCVDHQLRENSRLEAQQVCVDAEALGLSAHILTWTHDGIHSAMQEKARKARYELMADWCQRHEVPVILTAHHQDDQVETMLMRLLHGSGVDGLVAMVFESHIFGAHIVRPFLNVKRATLRAFVSQRGVKWIEDPSNGNDKFERVRVRAGIAALSDMGLETSDLAMSAKRIARAQAALEANTDQFMVGAVTVFDTGYASVCRLAYENAPAEIGLRALRRLVEWASGGALPVQLSKLERVYDVLQSGRETKVTLAGAVISARKKSVLIGREYGRMKEQILADNDVDYSMWDNRFVVPKGVVVQPYGVIIDEDQRAKPEDLPYFVACCLPAIEMKSGAHIVPHLEKAEKSAQNMGVKLLCWPKGMNKNAEMSQ